MTPKDVKHIVYLDMFIVVFTIICLIFSLIVILTDSVSAKEQTTTINPKVDTLGPCGASSTSNRYCATQTNQTPYSRTINNTYNGVLQCISFEYNYQFNSSYTSYVLSINAMSTDFRNNSLSLSTCSYSSSPSQCILEQASLQFISKSKLQISYVNDNTRPNHVVSICSDTSLTGISTYGIKNIKLTYDDMTGDNSDIIETNNKNTENIINNNNSNTQDVIGSIQDAALDINADLVLTADEIRLQTELIGSGCLLGPLSIVRSDWVYVADKYLNSSGQQIVSSGYSISPYLEIKSGAEYTFELPGSINAPSLCFYKSKSSSSSSFISCVQYSGRTSFTATAPNNANYMLVSFGTINGIKVTGPVCNDWVFEKESQSLDIQKETNNYLKDDSNPTLNNSGIDSALSSVEIDDPLNYLLTLPISLLQKLNTVLSSNSCQRVSFGSLYDTELYLPCINFSEILGTNIWNTIDLFVGVGLLAVILKKFYESISNILTMGKEKEVKDKLDLPTPMEFLASILGGGKD